MQYRMQSRRTQRVRSSTILFIIVQALRIVKAGSNNVYKKALILTAYRI